MNVLRHDGNSLSVDGTQIRVFKETNEVSLTGFLQSYESRALETEVRP